MPFALWNPDLLGGAPSYADPQRMTWYPLALLMRHLGAWNAFVISGYVIAATGQFAYVWWLSRSAIPASVAAIAFAFSSFLIWHLCHVTMLHAAAWVPLTLFMLHRTLRSRRRRFLVGLSLCFSLCFLAGHPQIFVYGSAVVAGYVCTFAPRGGRRAKVRLPAISLALVCGIGLAAIQWAPTIDLAIHSCRASLTKDEFLSHSIPGRQLLLSMLFPAFAGGMAPPYVTRYLGKWEPREITGSVGMAAIGLVLVGLAGRRHQRVKRFWLAVAVLGLLLASDATPLAGWAYYLPLFNKFRAQGRHLFEVTLALSVLAGLGADDLLRKRIQLRSLSRLYVLTAVFSIGGFCFVSGDVRSEAIARGLGWFRRAPWANPAVGLPLLFLGLSAGLAVLLLVRAPRSRTWPWAVPVLIALELYSSNGFTEWRVDSPAPSSFEPPAQLASLIEEAGSCRARIVAARGGYAGRLEAPPTFGSLWGAHNATTYGPLTLKAPTRVLPMDRDGQLVDWGAPEDQGLNLFSVRFVATLQSVIPAAVAAELARPHGRWKERLRIGDVVWLTNASALPRVQWVHRTHRVSHAELARAIRTSRLPDGSIYDPRSMALVGLREAELNEPGYPDESAEIHLDEPQQTEVIAKSRSRGLLILRDVHERSWIATVDGKTAPIVRVDGAFRGVELTPGEHRVVFQFRPVVLAWGAALSVLSLLGLAWMAAGTRRRVWRLAAVPGEGPPDVSSSVFDSSSASARPNDRRERSQSP